MVIFSKRKKKGQTAVFEEVMLFGIGVGIFIASFFIFNYYQDVSLGITGEDHMNEMLQYISSTVMDISKSEGNVSVIISIPEKINNEFYSVTLNNTGLYIETIPDGFVVSSNLYGITDGGINIIPATVASVSKKIMVHKKGNDIGINSINI